VSPSAIVWVGLAGATGAACRFLVDGAIHARLPRRLPFGTMAVNVSGSLLLGLLTGAVLFHGAPSQLTLVAGSGFCGGYTTFSTASFEAVRLLQRGEPAGSVLCAAVNLLGSLLAAALGLALAGL